MHWRRGGGGMSEGAGLRGGRWKTGSGSSPKPTGVALLLCFVRAPKVHKMSSKFCYSSSEITI